MTRTLADALRALGRSDACADRGDVDGVLLWNSVARDLLTAHRAYCAEHGLPCPPPGCFESNPNPGAE